MIAYVSRCSSAVKIRTPRKRMPFREGKFPRFEAVQTDSDYSLMYPSKLILLDINLHDIMSLISFFTLYIETAHRDVKTRKNSLPHVISYIERIQ